MANKIILKKSSVAAKVPLTTDLDFGELALNYRDGALYYKDHNGDVKDLLAAPPSGTGSGQDADFLDGIDSTEFLRSNVSDEYTNGTLTFASGTIETFNNGATVNFNNTGIGRLEATLSTGVATVTITDTTGLVAGQLLTKISGVGEFGAAATILTVDSPTQFTASIDHATAGAIVFSAGKAPFNVVSTVKVANLNADLLDGRDSTYFYSPDNLPAAQNETDTLETVTNRGHTGSYSTTTQKVEILNTEQSNGNDGIITEGALIVRGGVGVELDVHIKGDLHLVGTGTLRFGPYDVGATTGNLFWVRSGGTDYDPVDIPGAGEQLWTAFGSVKHALKFANFGDTVLVQPGEYEEIFPLIVPAGVSLRGAGLRETQIYPTAATNDNDAFLLSGDSTISDFTVKNFFYDNVNDTGYAFRFVTHTSTLTNGTASVILLDSAGIEVGQSLRKLSGTGVFGSNPTVSSVDNIVISSTGTVGSVAGTGPWTATITGMTATTGLVAGAKINATDGTGSIGFGGTYRITSVGPTSVTYAATGTAPPTAGSVTDVVTTGFTASVNHATSGSIVFTNAAMTARSSYVERCTVLTRGSVTSGSDPYGFLEADAGRGALIDGSIISRTSIEAAMLFNELTFIVPNSRGIIMTNGARSEVLTTFFYFADLAVEGVVGAAGRGGDGKTYIRLGGQAGTWASTNTISQYDTDGTTVIASATIESVNGDTLTIDGSVSGFIVQQDRVAKTVTPSGNAQLDTAIKKFGTGSLLLDGTGDYLTVDANSDFQFDGDFAVEGWFYPTDLTGNHVLWCVGAEVVGSRFMCYLSGSQVTTDFYGVTLQSYTSSISLNTWTHIAVSRSGSNVSVYINGTACPETDNVSGTLGEGFFKIGSNATGGAAFAGQIDEFRVTKNYRRYTGNFTAPAAAFVGDADTVLLLHFNGTDGSTIIVDDGAIQQDIRSSAGGTATAILRYDRSEFAAEMRAIACAYVYGNQGIKADGADVLLQLMAHNFAYIGTGADLTNDKSAVIQANEVIEINGGKVYFNSVDQSGDFRVGDYFSVNFETGAVTFSGGTFDVSALGSITFTDGGNQTSIDASQISTGNLVLSGSTLSTVTGNLTLDPGGAADIVLNGDTSVTGTLTVSSTLTHGGLVMSDGGTSGTNNVDQLVTITKSLTLTTDWQDTGINGAELATGSYLLQLYANDFTAGGTSRDEYYSGVMSWYAGNTDSSVELPTDEIQLHRAGGSSDAGLYLRTFRTASASPDNLKLQIYSNLANSSASNYVFKFRRMI